MDAVSQDARAVEVLTQRRNFRDYAEIAKVLGCSKTSAFRLVKRLEGEGLLRMEAVRGVHILPGNSAVEVAGATHGEVA